MLNQELEAKFEECFKRARNRANGVELEKAKGRLEWAVDKNPEITPERIMTPPYEHRVQRALIRENCKHYLKNGVVSLALLGSLCCCSYLGFQSLSANGDSYGFNETKALIDLARTLIPIGPAAIFSALAARCLAKASKKYYELKNSRLNKPLTEKEIRLAEYIYMQDLKK